MTYEKFKRIHSELIMSVQYIEQDLRIIYMIVKGGDYRENMDTVSSSALGKILVKLKEADKDNDAFQMSEEDYKDLDDIRDLRNYWCHECYLDFHYIVDPAEHEIAFQMVAKRLHTDEARVYALQQKVENLRIEVTRKLMEPEASRELNRYLEN